MVAFASAPRATGYQHNPQFVAVTTWSNIKALSAATYNGKLAFATDIGNGAIVRSNGTRWAVIGPRRAATLSAPVTVQDTAVQTEVASFTVPGDLCDPVGGVLWIFAHYTFTSSANAKTFTTTIGGSIAHVTTGYSGSAGATLLIPISLLSASSEAAISGSTSGIGAGGTATSQSINNASDYLVKLYVTMASGAETTILKNANVEVH